MNPGEPPRGGLRLRTSRSGAILAVYAAALLVLAMMVPWWRMESRAPQYGKRVLVVSVSPMGVAGDIQELDELGHYVGMRTLDTFAPTERTLAPYGVAAVALAALALPFLRTRRARLLAGLPVFAVPIGFVADLYAWQRYAVTHLDPTAALNTIASRVDARVLGHYSVAQFHVDASFQAGFWLTLVAAANILGVLIAEGSGPPASPSRSPRVGAAVASAGAALLLFFSVPRDAGARTLDVGPGTPNATIAQAIAAASAGDEVVIHAGLYTEHLEIDRPLTLRAEGEAILDGGGRGTLLHVTAGPTVVRGLSFRGTGDSLLGEDAAIRVERAAGCLVEHNRISDALFGILAVSSPGTRILHNHVIGKDLVIPRRGDGIRVFASDGSLVEDNVVERSRDLAIWNSNRVDARRNRVRDSRYGLHFMFCDDNTFEDNVFEHNQTGGAIMYSHRLTLRRNRFEGSRGPSAHGLLIKMGDDVVVENNWFLDDTRGIFLSDTPSALHSGCTIRGNVIGGNEVGVAMEPSVSRVVFTENAFIANRVPVEVLGTTLGDQNVWSFAGKGNYWSDYVGFDADGDGIGDVPYRLDQFFENLAERWPAVGLLRMSPASQALDLAARAFPIVQPQATLTDHHPLVRPPAGFAAAPNSKANPMLAFAGLVVVGGAGGLAARSRRGLGRTS